MKKEIQLIAAPTVMQPGEYILKAYANKTVAETPKALVDVSPHQKGWKISVQWACEKPISDASENVHLFVDSVALLVPQTADAPWVTMGDKNKGVEGLLWRADQSSPYFITAQGLGSVERATLDTAWQVESYWQNNIWTVSFITPQWVNLEKFQQLSIAVWQGHSAERAGLKSISAGWLSIKL